MVSTSAAEARATGAAPRRWPGQEGRSCQSVPRGKHVRGSRPSRRSSLSRPREPPSERGHGHQVSTGSTGDRFSIETTSRGLDRLDQRSVQYRDHDTRSRQARPAIGSVSRPRHQVSTGSTSDRFSIETTSPGLDKLDQRLVQYRDHVTRSRQARPAIGSVSRPCHQVSTSSTSDWFSIETTTPGLDKLDRRSVQYRDHVTRSRQARPAIGSVSRPRHQVSTGSTSDRSRPSRRSSLSRPREPSSERRHGHQISTGSTGGRFNIETSRPAF
jgi:hypothetical protein